MLLSKISWIDFIDVILVAFLIYQLYKIIKGTVAIRIFVGIFFIYLFWKVTEVLKMELLSEILGQFIGVGVIALIIVFQQELRRFLLLIKTRTHRHTVNSLPLLIRTIHIRGSLIMAAALLVCRLQSLIEYRFLLMRVH